MYVTHETNGFKKSNYLDFFKAQVKLKFPVPELLRRLLM